MKLVTATSFSSSLLIISLIVAASAGSPGNETGTRYIIKYRPGRKSGVMAAIVEMDEQMINEGKPPLHINYDFERINVVALTATGQEMEQLKNNTDIDYIEPDVVRKLLSLRGGNHIRKLDKDGDEILPYGVELVGAPILWEQGYTGQGVKVCVIDSGIDGDHPDFILDNLKGYEGTDEVWSEDGCGHGTHVTGTIAAEDDEEGVVGVAPGAEIFTVRVFGDDCGFVFGSDIYQAAYECQEGGANIISMSLGGAAPSSIEEGAFQSLFDDNILSVAAAGNDGNSDLSYPASYSSVMSVAALDSDKQHAPFSQYNEEVDIAGPGVDVKSTFPVGACAICGTDTKGYGAIDGTSMATPHVSAVAALLWSFDSSLSAADLRNALESTAEDLGFVGRDDYFGYGLVRADRAFTYLGGDGGGGGGIVIGCDDTAGWYDEDGPTFDCSWYEEKDNCDLYGDLYENDGQTANQACCQCGGGIDVTQPPGPTPAPSDCEDTNDWYDSEGPEFDCEWYSYKENCANYGDLYSNFGKTANQACCTCQEPDLGPPPDMDCPESEQLLRVAISFDAFPSEISWAVEDVNTLDIRFESPEFDDEIAFDHRSKCVKTVGVCNMFIIKDTYGDGLFDSVTEGAYEVSLDGMVVGSGVGNFGFNETLPIGGSCE